MRLAFNGNPQRDSVVSALLDVESRIECAVHAIRKRVRYGLPLDTPEMRRHRRDLQQARSEQQYLSSLLEAIGVAA